MSSLEQSSGVPTSKDSTSATTISMGRPDNHVPNRDEDYHVFAAENNAPVLSLTQSVLDETETQSSSPKFEEERVYGDVNKENAFEGDKEKAFLPPWDIHAELVKQIQTLKIKLFEIERHIRKDITYPTFEAELNEIYRRMDIKPDQSALETVKSLAQESKMEVVLEHRARVFSGRNLGGFNLRLREPRGHFPKGRASWIPEAKAGYLDQDQANRENVMEDRPRSPLPVAHAIAKLNRVKWAAFKQPKSESDIFAIDVLIGEPPVVTRSPFGDSSFPLRKGKPSTIQKENANQLEDVDNSLPGSAPLPERIRINSPQLIRIFEKIHGSEVSENGQPIIIIRPFKALVYYESQLRNYDHKLRAKIHGLGGRSQGRETPTDITDLGNSQEPFRAVSGIAQEDGGTSSDPDNVEETLQHLQCLLEFINVDLRGRMGCLSEGNRRSVTFDDIWYLFRQSHEVIDQDERQAYRVIGLSSTPHKNPSDLDRYHGVTEDDSEEHSINLHCVYVDFDGTRLGPVSKKFIMPKFDGERDITSLPVYPLRYSRKPHRREDLINRGRTFIKMSSVNHMYYKGSALDSNEEVASQVVIDFEEAFSIHPEWKPVIENLVGHPSEEQLITKACSAECCRDEIVLDDAFVERELNEQYIAALIPDRVRPSVMTHPRNISSITSPEQALGEDELRILPCRVFGFVLQSQKWEKLDLANLGAVATSETGGFNHLVLPHGHEAVIQSLIAQHLGTRSHNGSHNARGNLKGLCILLHGAPGVGKTSTIESAAHYFRKTLFEISCGDLGLSVRDVEETLTKYSALANKWDCILAIDEAEALSAKRTLNDRTHLGLLTVFLRFLDSYKGILFLTTNRLGDIDEAVASRIHMSLYFPQLSLDSTLEIFQQNWARIKRDFSSRGRKLFVDIFDLVDYAKIYYNDHPQARWNGRQIRNACQTAAAFAEFEAQGKSVKGLIDRESMVVIGVKHLRSVASAHLEFAKYLSGLYDADGSEGSTRSYLRPDAFQPSNVLASNSGQARIPVRLISDFPTIQHQHQHQYY
ncbi:hypothetical protein GGR58DRAFT_492849 [Xylaria digitata]|nr:hypothetical protein GGR58DRAFT_492849 [Xylaria digitata]